MKIQADLYDTVKPRETHGMINGCGIRRKAIKAAFILLFAALLTLMFAGCSDRDSGDERTVVSILNFSGFDNLEKLVEETYSDIDLIAERLTYPSEQMRRIENGVGPDLIILSQPSNEIAKKFLLDISDTSSSVAYDGTVMKQLQSDGITYFIPLPGEYSGYIINETMFARAGIELPGNNAELLAAVSKLKDQGIGIGEDGINFSICCSYDAELGMYYTGCMVPDFLGTVDGVAWLAGFRRREAGMADAWSGVFDLTDKMIEAGIIDTAAMSKQRNLINDAERLGDGTLALAFGTSSLYQQALDSNKANVSAGTAEEYSYRMLPLLSSGENEPWIILSPSSYMGVNAGSEEKRREAAKRVLDLISTPEGQDAVMKDMQMGFSYLREHQSDAAFIPSGLDEYIESGYIYNVQFPDRIIEYLGNQMRKVLAGKLTLVEALDNVDAYNISGSASVDYDLSVVGTLEETMPLENYNVRRGETAIGNFIADCVAAASGAPIAVVNGGGIRGSLYEGEITGEDLSAVCPYENLIIVLETDGKTLWDMLENGLSSMTEEFPSGRFLQVSGIHLTVDSSKPAGDRLVEVKLADGTLIDPSGAYTIAVNNYMAGIQGYVEGNGDGYTMINCYDDATPLGNVSLIRETEMTYRDALALYFEKHADEAVSAKIEGRIINISEN